METFIIFLVSGVIVALVFAKLLFERFFFIKKRIRLLF